MRHWAILILLFYGCEQSVTSIDAPDLGFGPDAKVPQLPDARPTGALILRGAAGEEDLLYRTGSDTVQLTASGGRSICRDRPFCDAPPSGVLGRILFYDFMGSDHALYLEMSAPTEVKIRSVRLDGSEATELSAQLRLGDLNGSRPGWVYAFGQTNSAVYFSLWTTDGYRLYKTSEPQTPLRSIAHVPFGPEHRPVQSWVRTDGERVVWTVETLRQDPQNAVFEFHAKVLDAEETLLFDDAALQGEAILSPPLLAKDKLVFQRWPAGSSGSQLATTEVRDLASGARCTADRQTPAFLIKSTSESLSTDGRRFYERDLDRGQLFFYDTADCKRIATMNGDRAAFSPDSSWVSVQYAFQSELVLTHLDEERTIRLQGEQGLVDFTSAQPPAQLFSDDGRFAISLVGSVDREFEETTGIRVIPLDGSAAFDVRPPSISEDFPRMLRLQGERLYFLDDDNGQLDIVVFDLESRSEEKFVESPRSERGFVLGAAREGDI